MDQHTFDNWKKIKTALEEANKTDCMFYLRACSILKHKVDPLDNVLSKKQCDQSEEEIT
jgi:hypothetical protein